MVDGQALVVHGEWTIMITIDEPQPPPDLLPFVRKILAIPAIKDNTSLLQAWLPGWRQRLRRIVKECSQPRRWWRNKHSRQRRGLFNAIGSGLQFLFGTATDDDLDDVRRMVNSLAANQGRIYTQMAQFTTIVNHTYDEIQWNRNQINLISSKFSRIVQELDNKIRGLAVKSAARHRRFDMEMLLAQLEDVSRRFVRSHEAWLHRKENLEAGRLTENILPPTVLMEILSQDEEGQMVSPIQWYYEHAEIIPIWTEKYLVYKTRLPVVLPVQWHYVTLRQWPMPLQEYQAELVLPSTVLRNTETGELDVSPRCYGARPRVCRRGLISRASIHPCLTRLLADVPSYDPQCAVVLQRRFPMDTVHPIEYNKYILVTDGTELALRCAGTPEQRTQITSGVYELTLAYPCYLHAENWRLTPTYQRFINVTLESEVIPLHVNDTIVDMFNAQVAYDPTVFGLADMEPVDRKQITVNDLAQPFGPPMSSNRNKWHGFWVFLVGVLVAGGVFGWRRHRQHRASGSPTEIEMAEVSSNAVPVHTSKRTQETDDTRVFRFTGQSAD